MPPSLKERIVLLIPAVVFTLCGLFIIIGEKKKWRWLLNLIFPRWCPPFAKLSDKFRQIWLLLAGVLLIMFAPIFVILALFPSINESLITHLIWLIGLILMGVWFLIFAEELVKESTFPSFISTSAYIKTLRVIGVISILIAVLLLWKIYYSFFTS